MIAKLLLPLSLVALPALAPQSEGEAKKAPSDQEVVESQLPSYPLETCPVSGKPLGNAVDRVIDGRLVRFCCGNCPKTFAQAPDKYLAVIDAAVIADQGPRYPLETCVVSGEPMGGEMGPPVDVVVGTRLVRFCCGMCKKSFAADPATYMAELDQAWIASQVDGYPLETCPVSGEKLGSMGEPVDVLYGTRLVRLCCKGCAKGLKKDPQAALAKIDAARTKEAGAAKSEEQGG